MRWCMSCKLVMNDARDGSLRKKVEAMWGGGRGYSVERQPPCRVLSRNARQAAGRTRLTRPGSNWGLAGAGKREERADDEWWVPC